jgi:hypothetical protein
MGFFTTDPYAKLAADAQAARDHRDRMIDRLADARKQKASTDAKVATLLANNADDAAVAKAEAASLAAEGSVKHRAAALEAAEVKLEACEREHVNALNAKIAEGSLAQIKRDDEEFVAKHIRYVAAGEEFKEIVLRKACYVPEGHQLAHFLARAPVEIELIAEMVQRGSDGWAGMIRSGAAPAKLPTPEAPAVAVAKEPKPETIDLTCLHHIAWTDPSTGSLCFCARGHRPMPALPKELADHAIALKAAVPFTSPQANLIRKQMHSSIVPGIDRCVTLDDKAKKAKEQDAAKRARSHTMFERIDRGAPYALPVHAA